MDLCMDCQLTLYSTYYEDVCLTVVKEFLFCSFIFYIFILKSISSNNQSKCRNPCCEGAPHDPPGTFCNNVQLIYDPPGLGPERVRITCSSRCCDPAFEYIQQSITQHLVSSSSCVLPNALPITIYSLPHFKGVFFKKKNPLFSFLYNRNLPLLYIHTRHLPSLLPSLYSTSRLFHPPLV